MVINILDEFCVNKVFLKLKYDPSFLFAFVSSIMIANILCCLQMLDYYREKYQSLLPNKEREWFLLNALSTKFSSKNRLNI